VNKLTRLGFIILGMFVAAFVVPGAVSAECVKGSDGSTICYGGSDGYYWQTRDFKDGSGYVFQDYGEGRSYYENWNAPAKTGSTGGNTSTTSSTSGSNLWDDIELTGGQTL
jgi:hypothetical protein